MLECPDCEQQIHGTTCHRCGWVLPSNVKPIVPENQRPWTPPVYREPTPEEDAEIRAILSRVKGSPWWRNTQGTAPLPDVDPAIRAEMERKNGGPIAIGAVLPDVLDKAKPTC